MDMPAGHPGEGEGDDATGLRRTEDEVGYQRHAQTLGDQSQHRDIVLGLEGDIGDETGALGQREEVPAAAGTAGDPWVVPDLGEVGDSVSGYRVVRRDDEADLVIEQLADDEGLEVLSASDVNAFVGEGHGDIAVPGAQGGQRLRWLGLGEGDDDVGVPRLDQRECPRDQRRRGRREGHEPHPTGAQPRDRPDLLLSRVEG